MTKKPNTARLPHNGLITAAGREVLGPLGLTQRGTSRLWLDDNGWWLGVVEFQPSDWARGSYLNVGVMWLWRQSSRPREISFHVDWRDQDLGLVTYESDAQFAPLARELAERAASRVEHVRAQISDLAAAVRYIKSDNGWSMLDRGIALGLAGEADAAVEAFESLADLDDHREWWRRTVARALELAALLQQSDGLASFRDLHRLLIEDRRAQLKLNPNFTPPWPA